MPTSQTFEVMILEDHYYSNKILSKYVTTLLETNLPFNTKYKVHSYKSGTECILNIHNSINIAILDYYLTHDVGDSSVLINGHEVMRFIQKVNPSCKIIMVSSLRNPEVVNLIKKEGVYAYIDKHVQTHEHIGMAVEKAIQESLQ